MPTTPIRRTNGQFAGSIGEGRDNTPVPAAEPPRRARRASRAELSPAERAAAALAANTERREEALAWARSVPQSPAALTEYKALLAADLDVDPDTVDLAWSGEVSLAHFGELNTPVGEIEYARYFTHENGSLVGTPLDEASLRAVAGLERVAASARRNRRARVESVDDDGRRWVRYANESLSEVLRSVRYDEQDNTLSVTLRNPRENEAADGPEYLYRDVHPTVFDALISARSMGRFYSAVFSARGNGDSLAGSPVGQMSHAVAFANFMSPTHTSTGLVPKSYLKTRDTLRG